MHLLLGPNKRFFFHKTCCDRVLEISAQSITGFLYTPTVAIAELLVMALYECDIGPVISSKIRASSRKSGLNRKLASLKYRTIADFLGDKRRK